MQNILLQEIYSYNKNISLWNLINKRIIFKYWYAFIVPIFFLILSSYFHFSQSSILAIIFYILSLIIMVLLSIFFIKKQKQIVLQKYKYVINKKGNFKKNWGLKIQKKELEKLLGVNLGKEKLSFLIDNYEEFTKEIKYDYKITIFVVGLIGFLFKDYIEKFFKDLNDFLLLLILLLLLTLIIFFEEMILKPYILDKLNSKRRFIKILKTIYYERYV
ncbi:hypothetical protein [uncultured Capnocytophaga sp.]|uniref:hypothetical protein n=1 Tax=uncultured Capnocytophaga sp. TaxID=159273 RepID=UPI002619B23D|nr:hypothetical protein [uncultured Capnocytophaga sp.]